MKTDIQTPKHPRHWYKTLSWCQHSKPFYCTVQMGICHPWCFKSGMAQCWQHSS